MFKITKTIPVKTIEYEVTNYQKSAMIYDDQFIKIRSNYKRKMNTCFICNKKLEKDKPFAILNVKGEYNKVAHDECVDKITIKGDD